MVAICKHESCPWKVTLRKVIHSMSWRIIGLTDIHEGCTQVYENNMINSTNVAKRWRQQIKNNSTWKTSELKNTVKTTDKLTISKKQAYRAIKKARTAIEGESVDNFNKLWSYCQEIQRTNPQSTCIVKLSDLIPEEGKRRCLRMYMCWDACRVGFRFCRPLVDGCHLKGPSGWMPFKGAIWRTPLNSYWN